MSLGKSAELNKREFGNSENLPEVDLTPRVSSEARPALTHPHEFTDFVKNIQTKTDNLRRNLAEADQRHRELEDIWKQLDRNDDRREAAGERKQELEDERAELSGQMDRILTELAEIREVEILVNQIEEIDGELNNLDAEWEGLSKTNPPDAPARDQANRAVGARRIGQIFDEHEKLALERGQIREKLLEIYKTLGNIDTPEPISPIDLPSEPPIEPVSETPEEQAENLPSSLAHEVEETKPNELNVLSLVSLRDFALKETVESPASYQESLGKAVEVLKNTEGIAELKKDVPTIIVPDLHGRRELLFNVLNVEIEGTAIIDLLAQNQVNLVIEGDGVHTEGQSMARWKTIEEKGMAAVSDPANREKMNEFLEAMDPEMADSMGAMKMIMELKARFPNSFQYLRGDHDQIYANLSKGGISQSEWFRLWTVKRMPQGFARQYTAFESKLPLVAVGQNIVISHTPPVATMTEEQIRSRQAIATGLVDDGKIINPGLVQVNNYAYLDEPEGERIVAQTAANLGQTDNFIWFVGHRPAKDEEGNFIKYRSRANGKVIQMNSPLNHVYAIVPPDVKNFDPERDIKEIQAS